MKATPNDQKKLLAIQAFDTQLLGIERAKKTLPEIDALTELNTQLDDAVRRYGASLGGLEDAREELRRIEGDVAVVESRSERDSVRLQNTASVKDVQALETELQSLATRRNELDDIQLEVMEKVENLENAYAAIDTERQKIAESIAHTQQQRDEKLNHFAQQGAAAIEAREVLATSLPGELMALYERQRDRYGIGAALLRGGVSLGSNMKLNESDMADIRRAADDDVILCPDSSAILVRTEESGL